MTDIDEKERPLADEPNVYLALGELRGHFGALENRVMRFEDFAGNEFKEIREEQRADMREMKTEMHSMKTILQEIREQQARGAGVSGFIKWALALLASDGIGGAIIDKVGH